jgi:hypothetical protein
MLCGVGGGRCAGGPLGVPRLDLGVGMDGDVGCLPLCAFSKSRWGRGSEVWRWWDADGGWPPRGHDNKKVAGGGILASTYGKIPTERLPGLPVLVMTTPTGAIFPVGGFTMGLAFIVPAKLHSLGS